jgi:hypothetical protein
MKDLTKFVNSDRQQKRVANNTYTRRPNNAS